MRPETNARVGAVLGLVLALLLAACSGATPDPRDEPPTAPSPSTGAGPDTRPAGDGGEQRTLAMPRAYTPSAPTGVGTDDYRCFLLDPQLAEDRFLTGTDVVPGDPDVVHHVILFHVSPSAVAAAEERDADEEGAGWTCFGDLGLETGPSLDDAPWLAAWAPGGDESVEPPGYGIRLEAGSRIVMQVHYNLLAGSEPDVSAARLQLAAPDADLTEISTVLIPAPVELPCRPDHTENPLCDRDAAVADVKERFGERPGAAADFLHLLCGSPVEAGPVTTCERRVERPTTVLAAAGHMHLLGSSLTLEVNPDSRDARTLLDLPSWDFDDQGARKVGPVALRPGDEVRVTCRHDQSIRDSLPAFEGTTDRYVVWGEGTTDEMCLGILQVAYP